MADVELSLRWLGPGLEFEGGRHDGPTMVLDGNGAAGPSPVQLLLLSLGGCSAADVVEILGKMRIPLEALTVRLEGDRVADPPRRFTRIKLTYVTRGLGAEHEEKLRRAVALSHEKYCSVLHTIRPDVEILTDIDLG